MESRKPLRSRMEGGSTVSGNSALADRSISVNTFRYNYVSLFYCLARQYTNRSFQAEYVSSECPLPFGRRNNRWKHHSHSYVVFVSALYLDLIKFFLLNLALRAGLVLSEWHSPEGRIAIKRFSIHPRMGHYGPPFPKESK